MSAVLEVLPLRPRALLVTITRAGFLFGRVVSGIVASGLIPGAGWQSISTVGDIVKLLLAGVLTFALPEFSGFLFATSDAWTRWVPLSAESAPQPRRRSG